MPRGRGRIWAAIIVVIVIAAMLVLYVPNLMGNWRTPSPSPSPEATPTPVPAESPSPSPSSSVAPTVAAIVYINVQYGFHFALPGTWEGYTVVTDTWEGTPAGSDTVTESGPLLSIRHPSWTEDEPRQDIPIMVFTLAQWDGLEAEEFHIGAAPIGPSELGRNGTYVFALPARYNFAYLPGTEEVAEILEGNPLTPTEPE